jgi:hypothetical protein
VSNHPNGGARFCIELPLAAPSKARKQAAAEGANPAGAEARKQITAV